MSESRVARWRQRLRDEGLKAVTVWLSADEELRLKDLALQWHCAPSEIMQQALAQFHPGSPPSLSNASVTAQQQHSAAPDMAQLQATLEAILPDMVQRIVEEIALGAQIRPSDVSERIQRRSRDVTEMMTTGDISYDPARSVLGRLCPRGHDYQGTGKSLRRIPNRGCRQCETEAKRRQRQKH